MNKILLGLVVMLSVFGCKDSYDNFNPDDTIDPIDPPVELVFNASAFVEVFDAFGVPVEGAVISLGATQMTTNEFGVVFLDDVRMGTNTYVTVNHSSYFHGSRMFYPTEGNTHYVKVVLMDDGVIGEVQSDVGGLVTVDAGTTLEFPANAIVDLNGEDYTGTVSVSSKPIYANDEQLSLKMPGDLVGVTEEGESRALGSMGMVVVELRDDSGNLLQVKEGETVKMSLEVPAEMLSKAPSTIPMWYFDEAKGVWVEEGVGTLSGSVYVAELAHFSYWNCDAQFPIVKWGATFVYEGGAPAVNVSVCLTIIDLGAERCAWTDENGLVCGKVASDQLILLEVVNQCGDVVYSEQIGPYSDSTSIGPITIPTSSVTLTEVSGTAVDCDGNIVTDGYARVSAGQSSMFIVLDETDGSFEVTIMNCDESDVIVTIVDEGALKQSLPQTYVYADVIDAGEITVCEDILEFIQLDVEGIADPYVFFFPFASEQGGFTNINAFDSTNTGGNYFYISFPGDEPGTYIINGFEIGLETPDGEFLSGNSDMIVVITYYGPVGDFIIGTISGTLREDDQGGGGTEYPFTGTISALRN